MVAADSSGMSRQARVRKAQALAARIRVVDAEGREVCAICETASSAFARMRGLLGRDRLEPGHGMLINGAPSIQTFFMRFPIDVVFLGKDRSIVGISRNVKPWRTAGARHAYAALELRAGTADAKALQVGDVLTLEPLEE